MKYSSMMKKYKASRKIRAILVCLVILIISASLAACRPATDKKNDAAVQENTNIAGGDYRYDSIFRKIKMIISKKLSIDSNLVKPESRLAEDLGADELDTVEFIMELEKAFDILFSDETVQRIHTIDDAVLYVKDHTVNK